MKWCDTSDEKINKNKVKLTVTYDMGWQKRSYLGRYDSFIRHDFVIGGIHKEISDMVIYSKALLNFYALYKRQELA